MSGDICSCKTIRCKSSHHYPTPWLSPSLLKAIKKKQQAKRKAERTGVSDDIMNYKRLKSYLKILFQHAKVSYIQGGIPWAGINSVLGRHHRKQSGMDVALSLDSINDFSGQLLLLTNTNLPLHLAKLELRVTLLFIL